MIDLHSHILPNIDDGPKSLEPALEIARAALADGISVLAATPHVRHDHPTTPEQMESQLQMMRLELTAAEIPLELLGGGELSLELAAALPDETLHRFGLGGNPNALLIETPFLGWPLGLEQTLFHLRRRGYLVVLAHPERNSEVQERPERLEAVVESGTLVQLTAGALEGRMGPQSQRTAFRLIELELAHLLASDAHAASVRRIGLSGAVRAVGNRELADWLTDAVPAAIVAGSAIPPRPALRRRGLRLARSRRD